MNVPGNHGTKDPMSYSPLVKADDDQSRNSYVIVFQTLSTILNNFFFSELFMVVLRYSDVELDKAILWSISLVAVFKLFYREKQQ